MKKYSIGILLLLVTVLNPSLVSADSLSSSAPVVWNTSGQGSISVQVTAITGGGTITFACTVDNTNYVAYNLTPVGGTTAVTTTTTNGIWTGPLGPCNQFKLTIDTGTATVTQRTIQGVKYLPGAGGGGGGSGTVTSIATTSPITGGTITDTGTIACATCGVTGSPLSQFASTTSAQLAGVISNETGSSLLVFNTSPTLVTPLLGTPTSGNLVNTTGYPVASLDNLGTGVATFLATPSSANLAAAVTNETGSSLLVFNTSPTLVTPILGTPTSGDLSNTTNFPTTQLSGLGTGVATFLATPTSANLATAVTNETGTGALTFATSPTFTTSAIINEAVGSTALTLTGATQTASFPVISATQTWNNSGVAFKGILLNVTNTASTGGVAGAKLIDLQIGGNSIFFVTSNDGIGINSTANSTGRRAYTFEGSGGAANFGMYRYSDNFASATTTLWTINNSLTTDTFSFGVGAVDQLAAAYLSWNAGDTRLNRDGATDTLALRRTTNPQTFRVYETFTDTSNYERGSIIGANNATTIVAETAGTGTDDLDIGVTPAGTGSFKVNLDGHIIGVGTAPAVTNTSANSCGTTAATITGVDLAGKVTVGATAGTSCTITFHRVFPAAPACSVSNETTANLARATSTTTTVILAGTFVAGDVLAYNCLGF